MNIYGIQVKSDKIADLRRRNCQWGAGGHSKTVLYKIEAVMAAIGFAGIMYLALEAALNPDMQYFLKYLRGIL
jgi:hypothetical protein